MTTIILVDGIDGRTNLKAIEHLRKTLPAETIFLEEPHPFFAEMLKKVRESGKGGDQDEFILMWVSRFCLWKESVYPVAHTDVTIVIDRSYASTYAFQVNGGEDCKFEKSFFSLRDTLLDSVSHADIRIIHLYLRVSFSVAASNLGIASDSKAEKSLMRVRSGFDLFFGNSGCFRSNETHYTIQGEGDIGEQITKALAPKKVHAPE